MAQLDTATATWKSKITVDDTVNFGGDLAATGSSPASWSSGAQSIMRVAALAPTDYLELDFTVDARTAGHGLMVGFAPSYLAPASPSPAGLAASIWWDTDNTLKAFEGASLRASQAGLTLPMSCRIIYNAGVLTWRRNSGSDILFFTSARTVNEITAGNGSWPASACLLSQHFRQGSRHTKGWRCVNPGSRLIRRRHWTLRRSDIQP